MTTGNLRDKPGSSSRSSSDQLRVRSGKLSERSVIELLFFAYTTGLDGTLTCTHRGITKTLRFRSGKLLEAKSNDPHDSANWILYEMQKIDRFFEDGPDEEMEGSRKLDTMEILSEQIQMGHIQPSEIDEFMHRRVRRILHDLMSWDQGTYVMELSRIPRTDPPLKVHRSIPEMIMREVKTAPDPVGLRDLMANPDVPVKPLSTNTSMASKIKLTAVEQRILNAIVKPYGIRQLAERQAMGLEALARILLGLNAIDMIRVDYRSHRSVAVGTTPTRQELPRPKPEPISDETEPLTPEAKSALRDQALSDEPPRTAASVKSTDFATTAPLPQSAAKLESRETADPVEPLRRPAARSFDQEHSQLKHDSKLTEYLEDEDAMTWLKGKIERSFAWNFFDVLNLDDDASQEEILAAYKNLTKKAQSFASIRSESVRDHIVSSLVIFEEARTVLLNPSLRKQYQSLLDIVDVNKKIKRSVMEHRKGLQAYKSKRLPLAIVHLKFAAFLDKRNSAYPYKLIYFMAQNRQLSAAARMLQYFCIDNFGTNPHIIALSGLLYHRRGDHVRARMEYTKALKMNSELELALQGMRLLDQMK